MSEYREKLQSLLRELFQFDSADLDFGIYAVMNHKRDHVERFIQHDLLDAIAQGLQLQSEAQQASARAEFDQARQELQAEYGDKAFDAQGNLAKAVVTGAGQTARRLSGAYLAAQQALRASELSSELEGQVYNDLYRFFARYYDDGDFNSKRRYGGSEKYVIPYAGQEVLLHWANHDQYYVKTGEYFNDYRFTVDPAIGFSGATVHFRLHQVSVEQNNIKGEKRFFVLANDTPVQWDAAGCVLAIGYQYRPLAADEQLRVGNRDQQAKLNSEAEAAILKAVPDPLLREQLGKLRGEPGKERSLLAQHLARYTARNTRDYFIHRNLGGFLRRELDFFLKNEVLRLEELDWSQPALVQATAARIQTLQLIAGRIIDFLAQIEDFQKRLWEKRKFVVQSDYCVTLDRVPAALYGEIVRNDRQRTEWQALTGVALGPDADLTAHPFLMVDTAFYDAGFKARLLASFDDLDAACDGLLVHGENYQALRLLTPRYRRQVKCIYIDPPYNTGNDGFAYKDNFQHSSWLTMMKDRLNVSREFLADHGAIFVSIDDRELQNLRVVLDEVYGKENSVAVFVRKRRMSTGMRGEPVSPDHEYLVAYADSITQLRLFGNSRTEVDYPFEDARGKYRSTDLTVGMTKEMRPNQFYPIQHPKTKVEYWPPETRVWRFQPSTMLTLIEEDSIIWPDDNPSKSMTRPRFKTRLNTSEEHEKTIPVSTWIDTRNTPSDMDIDEHILLTAGMNQAGTKELRDLFGVQVLDYPKPISLIRTVATLATDRHETTIDFFAGSGTTAHAIMQINQENGDLRRYLLIEMGDHFDTILKPRIQKVAYAADWRDGKPAPGSPGQSHMFHYIRIESYEDSLNNLRARPLSDAAQAALYALPDYFLRYMLDFETAGSPSLLDTARFDRPFQYQLNITRGQATGPETVDLVTTFNFLLGLRVRTVRSFERPLQNSNFSEKLEFYRVVRVLGEDGEGSRVCVLWRDTPPLAEMETEKQWLQSHVLADVAYDLLYTNGESALPGALPIEGEFKRLMFEGAA